MNEVSFREKIVALQQEWLKDPYDDKRNKDFWYVMDSISDELIVKWADRAARIPIAGHSIQGDASEWLAVCNILTTYNYDTDKNKKLTPGQKRKSLFYVIRLWDDLEMRYFC
jgi:hypothetical protein